MSSPNAVTWLEVEVHLAVILAPKLRLQLTVSFNFENFLTVSTDWTSGVYSGNSDFLVLSKNLALFGKLAKNRYELVKNCLKSHGGRIWTQFLFGHINGFKLFQIFLVLILSCLYLLQESTTAGSWHSAVVIQTSVWTGSRSE